MAIRSMAVSSGISGMCEAPRNKAVESVFMRRMLAYSARKNKAKGPPAYSTLKPETSSDSPSVRSKGARLVSANVEMNHIAAKGQAGRISQVLSWTMLKVCSVKPPVKRIMHRRMRPMLTSYEMVWATARRAPIRAYFEFEAQPEPRIEYTAKLDMARINRIPRFRSAIGYGRGIGVQRARARVRAAIGVRRKRAGEEVDGRTGSLMNSFTPSAMG